MSTSELQEESLAAGIITLLQMGKDERQTDYRITQILAVVRGGKGFELCRFDSKVQTLLLNRVGLICEISTHLGS